MTRKEARDVLQEEIDKYGQEYDDSGIEALEVAIKELEEEPILEKIRAEIERKAHSGQWSDATMYGMLKAVVIIDKYKAGEDKE